jgi:hypothetical protein
MMSMSRKRKATRTKAAEEARVVNGIVEAAPRRVTHPYPLHADYEVRVEEYLDGFAVAIFGHNKELVGIPLRGVDKKDAERQLEAIRCAFDFGLMAMRFRAEETLWKMSSDVAVSRDQ